MKDNKSQYLNLPLPDPLNPLEFDVKRIMESLAIIDEHTKRENKNTKANLDKAKRSNDEAISKLDEKTKTQFDRQADTISKLLEAIKNLENKLDTHQNNTNDQFLKVFPKKSILLFSGALNEIPNGWAICDGKNGTPDLTNKFILGAGNNVNVGATGGISSHKHDITGNVHNHTLTISQMPHHSHNYWNMTGANGHFNNGNYGVGHNLGRVLEATYTGGNQPHNHGFNASASETSNIPPYYALAYIMKL